MEPINAFLIGLFIGCGLTWFGILVGLYQHGGWANISAIFAEQKLKRLSHRSEALERLNTTKEQLKKYNKKVD